MHNITVPDIMRKDVDCVVRALLPNLLHVSEMQVKILDMPLQAVFYLVLNTFQQKRLTGFTWDACVINNVTKIQHHGKTYTSMTELDMKFTWGEWMSICST